MNLSIFVRVLPLLAMAATADGSDAVANPLSKTIELLDSLSAKIAAEGDAANKAYAEYVRWCDDTSADYEYEVKTGKANKERLEADISKSTAYIGSSEEKIEELSASIANDEKELKEATAVRGKEAADFAASEAELVDAIGTLDRALLILRKEMQKNPAAFAQTGSVSVNNLVQTIGTIIDAASFPAEDQKKLTALVQAQQGADSDDDSLGAPATAAYKTHSTNIFDVLEDLKEKAEGRLAELRKAESSTKHNFAMLKQSLTDQISADGKDLNEEKTSKALTSERKAVAEGDLVECIKQLANDKAALDATRTTCMTVAADHESSTKSRNEELSALATAKKVLSETTSGAASHAYSFLQLDTRVDLSNAEVVNLLKRLAKDNHSTSLSQLASRVAAAIRYGAASGQDPFTKVKQLISDMISKLEAQALSDLTEKSYCDEEIAKSEAKKAELDAQLSKLSTKIDQAASASARLKADVKEIQAELSRLSGSQAEMNSIRMETHQEYQAAKADLSLGLEGVRKALSILRDYYQGSSSAASMLQDTDRFTEAMQQPAAPEQHEKALGAGGSVISILEVVESDFAKDLAVVETTEADAEAEYQKTSQTNKVTQTLKEQDVKYKTKEYKGLDKTISELSGDKDNTNMEYQALMEYYGKIKERCIAQPESYETRRSRREAEIKGLKEALAILEGETVFVQHGRKRGHHAAFLAAF